MQCAYARVCGKFCPVLRGIKCWVDTRARSLYFWKDSVLVCFSVCRPFVKVGDISVNDFALD